MAYDAAKAHEYYINYRKKGLKKGRKKGKGKTSTMSLLGTSTSGLNDEGKIQAALIKEKLKKEMNEALKKATTDEEKEKIRIEYSRKAVQQLAALKSDAKYAKPKAAKKTTGSSKSSNSKSSSSKSSQKSSSDNSKAKSSTSEQKSETTPTKKAPRVIMPAALNDVTPETVTKIGEFAERLKSMAKNLTPEQKASVQKTVQSLIDKLKAFKGALNG